MLQREMLALTESKMVFAVMLEVGEVDGALAVILSLQANSSTGGSAGPTAHTLPVIGNAWRNVTSSG